MAPKLPFMPFYGRDFYEDEKVRLMDHAERGIYLELLWQQWREGSLPLDEAELSKLVGISSASARLMLCFPICGDNRRRNPKLEAVRAEHQAIRDKLSQGGKERWARYREAQAKKRQGSKPSKSLARAELMDTEPDTEERKTTTWLTPFADAWQGRCGNPPFKKLATGLAPLVRDHPEPEVLTRWSRYLEATEARYCSAQRFAATYNTWGAPTPEAEELDIYELTARRLEAKERQNGR